MASSNAIPAGTKLTLSGISMEMPVKPYRAQVQMVQKIVQSLETRRNCLLESPTGTGKTLALLTASLAWQRHQETKRSAAAAAASEGVPDKVVPHFNGETPEVVHRMRGLRTDSATPARSARPRRKRPSSPVCGGDCSGGGCSQAETPPPGKAVTRLDVGSDHPWHSDHVDFKENTPAAKKFAACVDAPAAKSTALEESFTKADELKQVPKIFFGTRTHRQIDHIVKELSRTPYADIKYTILGSREQSCVNAEVQSSRQKTLHCKELIGPSGAGCRYYETLKRKYDEPASVRAVLANENANVWDIEDLVRVARLRKHQFCPYFASTRVLIQDASLVICPYNYLIDPLVRDGMNLNMKDHIVVLDEAHNMEDTCRDAATFSFARSELNEAHNNFAGLMAELEKYPPHERVVQVREACEEFSVLCLQLRRWLDTLGADRKLKSNGVRDEVSAEFPSEHIAATLGDPQLGVAIAQQFTKERLYRLKARLLVLLARDLDKEFEDKKQDFPRPSGAAMATVEKFLYFMEFYHYEEKMDGVAASTAAGGAANVAIVSRAHYVYLAADALHGEHCGRCSMHVARKQVRVEAAKPGGWRGKHVTQLEEEVVVDLWCMNPAIAFRRATSEAHTVVLASGTLCPIETFASELCTDFRHTLEGDHVVPADRIFACSMGQGPSGVRLRCVFDESRRVEFKDELGSLVVRVCETVPGGVLCFFPSYRFLTEMLGRWQTCEIWKQICKLKVAVQEPRENSDMQRVLNTYMEGISENVAAGTARSGSVMFAVYRGKVSEGLDFADDSARAVIAVGIPFPNTKDPLVLSKKEYNSRNSERFRIPAGPRWYDVQAYRALNQALGRCLRHRADWGALVLVDARFDETQKHRDGVSFWIRDRLQRFASFDAFIGQLAVFVDRMRPPVNSDSV